MDHLYKAYDMLDRELEDMVGSDGRVKTQDDVHLIKELSGGMKNLKTVIAMCEAEDDYSMANGGGNGAGTGGMSGARRGRSRTGSRSSYGMNGMRGGRSYDSRRGYSRDDSMDKVMEKIEDIKQTIQQMEND